MAQIPVVNGGGLPVFATDLLNGYVNGTTQYPQTTFPIASTDQPIPTTNFAGPKYDFYTIVFTNDISASSGAGGAVYLLMQTLQQYSTVAMYSIDQAGLKVSVALFPVGAWNSPTANNSGLNDASVQIAAAITALGAGPGNLPNGGTFDFTAGLAVTQTGFVLA